MIGVTTVAISTIPEIGINIGGGEAMEGTIFITAAEMAEILGISKPYACGANVQGSTLNRKSMVTKIITIRIMNRSVTGARLQKKWIMKWQLGLL